MGLYSSSSTRISSPCRRHSTKHSRPSPAISYASTQPHYISAYLRCCSHSHTNTFANHRLPIRNSGPQVLPHKWYCSSTSRKFVQFRSVLYHLNSLVGESTQVALRRQWDMRSASVPFGLRCWMRSGIALKLSWQRRGFGFPPSILVCPPRLEFPFLHFEREFGRWYIGSVPAFSFWVRLLSPGARRVRFSNRHKGEALLLKLLFVQCTFEQSSISS